MGRCQLALDSEVEGRGAIEEEEEEAYLFCNPKEISA
jgi:hypothetical protein